MSFVPTPVFRLLGVTMGFGVGIALLLAMTVTPILFSWMPAPAPWLRGEGGRVQRALDGALDSCARLASGRPWLVIAVFAGLSVAAAAGMTQLTVETSFVDRLDEDNQLLRDRTWLNERFSGSLILDLYVETPQDGGILDPETFGRIAALQDAASRHPGVDQAMSLVDLLRRLHRELGEDLPAAAGLPTSRQALAQYLLLFEMAGGERLERLVDFQRRTVRISLRLAGEGVIEAAAVGDDLLKTARDALGGRAVAQATGLQYLMGTWLDEIVAGQKRGLGFAFFAVALMMVLGLGSLRVGAWSMVPNTLPLLALGGYLGLSWGAVDSDVGAIAMIAIGIGVDDTIHFLMRLRIEWARQPSPAEAVLAAMRYAGRGIVITTVILVCGFLPMLLSDYFSVWVFGALLPFCLVVALLADLLLVPAMVQVGWVRFARS